MWGKLSNKLVTSDCLEISIFSNDINILGIQKRITGTFFHIHDIKNMTISFIILVISYVILNILYLIKLMLFFQELTTAFKHSNEWQDKKDLLSLLLLNNVLVAFTNSVR